MRTSGLNVGLNQKNGEGDGYHHWKSLFPTLHLERLKPTSGRSDIGSTADASKMVADALTQFGQVGLARLVAEAAGQGRPVVFVVNDAHRPTRTDLFVREAFAAIDSEISSDALPELRLLVAQGTHRAGEEERSHHEAAMLGDFAKRFDRIAWHDADDEAEHASIENLAFHRWLVERPLLLACGSMEPHYFAGVTGAHKTVTVGVMSRTAIEANHAAAMDPRSGPLRCAGNPVYDGITDAVHCVKRYGIDIYCINQVVVDGRVTAVTGGDVFDALDAGMDVVHRTYVHAVGSCADLVIAEVSGPLARDLYQADKGIKNTEFAVKDGGVLILEAPCENGVGIDHFLDLLRDAPSYEDAISTVEQRGYRLGDHKAVKLRALTDQRGVAVAIVSAGLDPGLADTLGMPIFRTRESAAVWATGQIDLAESSEGLVVEDAGNVTLEVQTD